ncbi:MAG: hypothetical protein OES25_10195 [Acidobacteriota bacterium]|nr:hypothetical protein [Acidobacteriota bacterium]
MRSTSAVGRPRANHGSSRGDLGREARLVPGRRQPFVVVAATGWNSTSATWSVADISQSLS